MMNIYEILMKIFTHFEIAGCKIINLHEFKVPRKQIAYFYSVNVIKF